jgi:hypothetical protein
MPTPKFTTRTAPSAGGRRWVSSPWSTPTVGPPDVAGRGDTCTGTESPGSDGGSGYWISTRMLSRLVTAGSDLSITLLHADVHEGTFALRRQVISDILAGATLPSTCGTRRAHRPTNRSTDATPGMMDLSQVDLPVDATSYRDPAARRAAALTCERRPDRLCWNAGRPDCRVDRLTPSRSCSTAR